MAWDIGNDLVAVGIWAERDRLPPPSERGRPGLFELRRIGTGEVLLAHDCELKPHIKCEFQSALASAIPPGTAWRTGGSPPPPTLRILHRTKPRRREVILESRVQGRWQPLSWLQVSVWNEPERRRYHWHAYDSLGDEAMLAFEVRARGGNCPNTLVRVFRMPLEDVKWPRRPARALDLLSRQARLDERFEHWLTIADLGPLPPARLMEALEAAEREEQYTEGAEWYRQTLRTVTVPERQRLGEAVKKNENLYFIRRLVESGHSAH